MKRVRILFLWQHTPSTHLTAMTVSRDATLRDPVPCASSLAGVWIVHTSRRYCVVNYPPTFNLFSLCSSVNKTHVTPRLLGWPAEIPPLPPLIPVQPRMAAPCPQLGKPCLSFPQKISSTQGLTRLRSLLPAKKSQVQELSSCLSEKSPKNSINLPTHSPCPCTHLFGCHPSLARSMSRFL